MVAFAGISIIIIAGIFSLPLIGRGFSPTSFPAELATATPSSTPTPTKTSTTIKTNIPVSTGTFTLSDSVSTPMTGNIPVTNNTPDPSCYRMNFISDVTIPDGTVVNPGQSFTKTWRVVNSGACAWKPGFTLRFIGGEKMHEEEATLDQNVEPGETFDFSVPMVAPTKLGRSISNWRLSTANGYFFGDQFFVDIIVK